MKQLECFSCGALAPDIEGSVHRYMDSSPGCWALYGEVLAREYSDVSLFQNHRLTVDAYALQHPGSPSPQSIQSIAVHLCSLFLVFERGSALDTATAKMKRLSMHKSEFSWLEPQVGLGAVSVQDVWVTEGVSAHLDVVKRWAATTWAAWEQHHAQVHSWVKLCG